MELNEIIEINKKFHTGTVRSKSSLDFAVSAAKHTKNWIEQLAYLLRAIIIDHPFEDGNKRTALVVLAYYFEKNNLVYNEDKITRLIIKIAVENINDIKKLGREIKNVIE